MCNPYINGGGSYYRLLFYREGNCHRLWMVVVVVLFLLPMLVVIFVLPMLVVLFVLLMLVVLFVLPMLPVLLIMLFDVIAVLV